MKYIFILLFVVLVATGCDKLLLGKEDTVISLNENLQPPQLLNDGWQVSTMAAENINEGPIDELITNLQSDPDNIHSLLIFRNNKLVTEAYFDGWHRDRLHSLRSASKSFVSTLIGIAIDKGNLTSVDQKVFDFFPEYADLNNAQKSQITIRHLLTMTLGLQWNETTYPDNDYRNDEYAIERSNNRLRYLLSKEQVAQPGSVFLYNSAAPILESGILKKVTGLGADAFAETNLFAPLGITNYFWRMNSDGYVSVAPLFLRPRDMGKLGQLFLDSGKWKGEQIISSGWVSAASATSIVNTQWLYNGDSQQAGYGYHWWTLNFKAKEKIVGLFAAEGLGGQYIFVVPSSNAVVVFTGGNYTENQYAPYGMMSNIILPAML